MSPRLSLELVETGNNSEIPHPKSAIVMKLLPKPSPLIINMHINPTSIEAGAKFFIEINRRFVPV